MREMKDSGIEWIGKIPKSWNYVKLKHFFEFEKGKNASLYTQEYISNNCGEYPVYSGQTENDGIMGKVNSFDYDMDECLFSTTVGAKVMTPKVLTGKFSLSQNCLIMKRIKECNNKFFYYMLISLFDYEKAMIPSYMQPSLRVEDLKIYSFYIPNEISEQNKIVDFLDEKITEIDIVIAKTKQTIEDYKSYKQSIITKAVTKGLDTTVKMKNSGMKWIGEVPEHWNISKIKHHLKRNEPRNPGNKIVLSLYREFGIIPKDSRNDNHNVTSDDTSNYKYVRYGDFVVNKMKAWQGSVAVSDYEGIVSPAYYVYNFIDNIFIKKYFHYLLRGCYKDEFRRLSGGIRIGQWDLPSDALDNVLVLIPSIKEQKEIVEFIDENCTEIDNLIISNEKLIGELENYKKSLIYEYVTGKKEVI